MLWLEKYRPKSLQDFYCYRNEIVKINFVSLKKSAPNLEKLRTVFFDNSDFDFVREYCNQFADKFYLFDTTWVYFNEILQYLPNDIVVEVPAVINKKGANGKKLDNYPKTFGALLNSQTGVIQLTTEAILNKSKHGAYLALLSDPIVDDAIKAEKLLNTMINKQSKFLGYLN